MRPLLLVALQIALQLGIPKGFVFEHHLHFICVIMHDFDTVVEISASIGILFHNKLKAYQRQRTAFARALDSKWQFPFGKLK